MYVFELSTLTTGYIYLAVVFALIIWVWHTEVSSKFWVWNVHRAYLHVYCFILNTLTHIDFQSERFNNIWKQKDLWRQVEMRVNLNDDAPRWSIRQKRAYVEINQNHWRISTSHVFIPITIAQCDYEVEDGTCFRTKYRANDWVEMLNRKF